MMAGKSCVQQVVTFIKNVDFKMKQVSECVLESRKCYATMVSV